MKKEKIINILESNSDLIKFGIAYPLGQENVKNNILLYLESSYLYLIKSNGCIAEDIYKNYLQKIISFYFYGDVKDFHKGNCYQLLRDKQEGLPWHLCTLMKFDTEDELFLTMMTLQRIVYSNMLADIINCYRENSDKNGEDN